ncbi:MAG TPA: alpha/beta hydrolase [Gammaproteobacteria bacterium]|nr:alpha/beta hydrolase [Gammaproteobacteria bacterium]
MASAIASRTRDRIPESSGFLENRRGRRLFHVMTGKAGMREGWIFCNPFLEEKVFTQPVYRHFARTLAARGEWVLRFDYEGDGDSEGELDGLDLAAWIDDVEDMAEIARNRLGIRMLRLFGLRLGGAIAVSAAARVGARSVHTWHPVVKGGAYFLECLRYNLTTQLATHRRIVQDRGHLLAQLEAGQPVNILGYQVGPALAASVRGFDLVEAAQVAGCRVDVIGFARASEAGGVWRQLEQLPNVAFRALAVPQFWHEPRFHDAAQPGLIEASLEMFCDIQ